MSSCLVGIYSAAVNVSAKLVSPLSLVKPFYKSGAGNHYPRRNYYVEQGFEHGGLANPAWHNNSYNVG